MTATTKATMVVTVCQCGRFRNDVYRVGIASFERGHYHFIEHGSCRFPITSYIERNGSSSWSESLKT